MASTYTDNLGIEKPGSGEQAGTWGTTTNTNFDIIDRAVNGVLSLSLSGTTTTLTTTDGALSDGGHKVLLLAGSPSGTNTITISPNDQDKLYLVKNSSGQTATFTQGSGGNASVLNGETAWVFADGAGSGAQVQVAAFDVVNDTTPQLGGNLDVNGNSITSASNGNVVIAPNGTGDVQLDTDTVRVGDSNANATITTNGTGDLTLNTNAGTNSGSVVIADGANNNVTLTANGTGKVAFASDLQINGTTNNWSIEVDSNDHLIFKYNGTAVFAIQDTGAVIAKDDITAFGTVA
tara:strand:- start:1237 stop:2112 length:876 start_codon:yes stop_codon:yes gene_type:complete